MLQKPYYNQSTEIHATLKESLTAIEPHLSFNGTANGFVPGRPVLDVPGWRERYTNTAASANSNYNAMSRLRIFSGTSNPVSKQLLHGPMGLQLSGSLGSTAAAGMLCTILYCYYSSFAGHGRICAIEVVAAWQLASKPCITACRDTMYGQLADCSMPLLLLPTPAAGAVC